MEFEKSNRNKKKYYDFQNIVYTFVVYTFIISAQ